MRTLNCRQIVRLDSKPFRFSSGADKTDQARPKPQKFRRRQQLPPMKMPSAFPKRAGAFPKSATHQQAFWRNKTNRQKSRRIFPGKMSAREKWQMAPREPKPASRQEFFSGSARKKWPVNFYSPSPTTSFVPPGPVSVMEFLEICFTRKSPRRSPT